MAKLNPAKALRPRCDLSAFSTIHPLPIPNIFPALFSGIFDLLLINTHYEAIQELFINSVFFFPLTSLIPIESHHSKFIREFLSALLTKNQNTIKSMITSPEFSALFNDLQALLPKTETSAFAPFLDLLTFAKVVIIEKSEGFEDFYWGSTDPFLQIFVYSAFDEMFLLFPKEKIVLNADYNPEDESDSILLPFRDDEILEVDEISEELSENLQSYEETSLSERQEILNKGKAPILKTVTQQSSHFSFSELSLTEQDQQRFGSSICLNSANFFTTFTLAVLNMFATHGLYHISLQIFTNSLYFFPFTQTREYERKHLKFTQEFINAFTEEREETVKEMLKSEEITNILDEISEKIEKNTDSAIEPLFPLIQTWKLSLVEKSQNFEYLWQAHKPLATLYLYLHDDQVHLLVPKARFGLKEFRVRNESIEKHPIEDPLVANKDEETVEVVDSDVLEADKQETSEDTLQLSQSKSVKFKPNLTIETEVLESSPLPVTPKPILKKFSETSPEAPSVKRIPLDSPVLKYMQKANKYKSPVERYVALAKAKAKSLKKIN